MLGLSSFVIRPRSFVIRPRSFVFRPLQPPQVKPTIHVNHLTGRKIEMPFGNCANGLRHVLGPAPALYGRQTLRNEFIILLRGSGGHIGCDDAGTNFEHADAVFRQAVGIELRHHADTGLADAIFPARRRAGVCRYGPRVHDPKAAVWMLRCLLNHPSGHLLCEEVGTLQVDSQDPVEALLCGLQQIRPFQRRNARVIDQHIAAAEFAPRQFYEFLPVLRTADVGAQDIALGAERGDLAACLHADRLVRFAVRREIEMADDEVEVESRQLQRYGLPDAPACAGNNCDRSIIGHARLAPSADACIRSARAP